MGSRSRIEIPVEGDEVMEASFHEADDGGVGAGVVVIHDVFGLQDDTIRIADRLASMGYTSLAPDLYSGRRPKALCVVRTLREYVRGEGQVFGRLEAARRWLGGQPSVEPGRVGAMGFCMGGKFVILWGIRSPLTVIAPFYGEVPEAVEDVRGICPAVGGWGERDKPYIEHGRRLVRHMDELGIPNDIAFYPDAGHGFMNRHGWWSRPMRYLPVHAGYDDAASEDSWERVERFFAAHL